MNRTPLITIMMATYNRAGLIEAAIQSVQDQTYQNWELLILDDASTDSTDKVVARLMERDPRIKYDRAAANLGIAKNRNRTFGLASGEYMAVLDSDDYWTDRDKLAEQVQFLETHPDHVLVGTQVEVVNDTGHIVDQLLYETNDEKIKRKLLLRNQFTHSAIMWRPENNFRYDETLPLWEDYDLILRLGLRGKLANLSETMTAYRRHGGNISRGKKNLGAKTHLAIINRYRSSYPNYFPALIKGWLRFII